MCYDSSRGLTLLYGGEGSGGETWGWNGSTWSIVEAGGPPNYATGAAMAHDPVRHATVLFGGHRDGLNLGTTWELTSAGWAQRSTTGPSPRSKHSLVYDAAHGTVVLFGGSSNSPNLVDSETWSWNGSAWTALMPDGPQARTGQAMAYDTFRSRALIFGGADPNGDAYGETWQWTGSYWTLLAATGPSARTGASAAYDSIRRMIVLFGGASSGPLLSETWEWNGYFWSRISQFGPSTRLHHAMSYDPVQEVTSCSVESLRPDSIAATCGSGTAVRGRRFRRPARSPEASHAMAYYPTRQRTVLFGGRNADGDLADTWEWDGAAWSQIAAVGPSARHDHTLTFDAARGVLVLFGGTGASGLLGDYWEWNGSVWWQRPVDGPEPRSGHSAVYDSAPAHHGGVWEGKAIAAQSSVKSDLGAFDILQLAMPRGLRLLRHA